MKKQLLDDADEGELVGYARVSTQDQNLDAQIAALMRAGVDRDRIHTDTKSGASRKRPGLALLMKDVRRGDTVVVWKLDRFGRSVADLLKHLERLDAAGVRFKSLTESIDTTTPMGRFLLMLLASLAELERSWIAERTRATMQHKKAQGAKFGADFVVDKRTRDEIRRRVAKGEKVTAVARRFRVARGTVLNYMKHGK